MCVLLYLMDTSRGTRGDRCSEFSLISGDIHFYSRVTTRVDNLTGMHFLDGL